MYKPDPSRYPALCLLPDTVESRSYRTGTIPVLYYNEEEYGIPDTRECHRYFNREYFVLPGGSAVVDGHVLRCRGENLNLSNRERCLLFTFLLRPDKFLSHGEIRHIAGGDTVKVPLSRLRTKLNHFLSGRSPIRIDFHGVRMIGYYLGITVDNLWKTE